MNIQPIRTEADYEAAFAEIEGLMDAEPGTPEAENLDVLATLVDAWEAEHHPIEPPDPVEAIRIRMEDMGFDIGAKDRE